MANLRDRVVSGSFVLITTFPPDVLTPVTVTLLGIVCSTVILIWCTTAAAMLLAVEDAALDRCEGPEPDEPHADAQRTPRTARMASPIFMV